MKTSSADRTWAIIRQKYDDKGPECWSYRKKLINDMVRLCSQIEEFETDELMDFDEDYLMLKASLDEQLGWFKGEQLLVGLSRNLAYWERRQLANRLKRKFARATAFYNYRGELDKWVGVMK